VQHDQVNVSSLAQLGGTLDARLYNGFAPGTGDTFTVLKAGTISGQFANAPAGDAGLATPFGTFDVSYSPTEVVLSNFVADPLAAAASIGALNGHADDVLGGSAIAGGVDAAFQNNERGILYGQFDVIDGVALPDLIDSGVLDFAAPNFALPAGQLQVWNLTFEGDTLGPNELALVFGYDDTGLTLLDEAALDVFHFDNGMWTALGGTVDTAANTISVLTPGLSPFAVGLVPEPSTMALAIIALTGLTVQTVRRRKSRLCRERPRLLG